MLPEDKFKVALARIEGWADTMLLAGSSYANWDNADYSQGYDQGRNSAFEDLLYYIHELKGNL